MLSCEFCEIFKKIFFYRTPPVAASLLSFLVIEGKELAVTQCGDQACQRSEYVLMLGASRSARSRIRGTVSKMVNPARKL